MSEKGDRCVPIVQHRDVVYMQSTMRKIKVHLASVNGKTRNGARWQRNPRPEEDGGEVRSGFLFGSFSVPFSGGHTHVNLKREGLHESDC